MRLRPTPSQTIGPFFAVGEGRGMLWEDGLPPGLFDGVLARGPVREAVADEAWIRTLLEPALPIPFGLNAAGWLSAPAALRGLLDPAGYLGSADAFIDRALGTCRSRDEGP